MIKIGFLGAGRVAQHYAYIFRKFKINNYKIVGIADLEISKAKKLSKKFDCKFYNTLNEILDEQIIDLMFILTPSGSHYKNVKICLNNNINVLCEKPLTLKIKEGEELIRIAKKKNLILSVSYQNRLNPSIIFAKNLLEKKKFGKIISSSVRLRWCRYQEYYEDGWHGTWKMDGGVLSQQAIHHLDALNYLLGPIKSVVTKSSRRINKLEAEDTIVSIFVNSDGSSGTFEATTAARPKDIEASLSITGEKGFINIGGIALNKVLDIQFLNQKNKTSFLCNKYSETVKNGYGISHRLLIQGNIDVLLGKKNNNLIYAKDCISTTNLVHAFYKSNEKKQWTFLKNKPIYNKLGG